MLLLTTIKACALSANGNTCLAKHKQGSSGHVPRTQRAGHKSSYSIWSYRSRYRVLWCDQKSLKVIDQALSYLKALKTKAAIVTKARKSSAFPWRCLHNYTLLSHLSATRCTTCYTTVDPSSNNTLFVAGKRLFTSHHFIFLSCDKTYFLCVIAIAIPSLKK